MTEISDEAQRLKNIRGHIGQSIVREIDTVTLSTDDALWLHSLSRRAASAGVTPEGWQPIETIPKKPVALGWTRGPLVYVKPTWGGWDIGCWEIHERDNKNGGCVRMFGDDGSYDEQPTHWCHLLAPPVEG